MEESIKGSGKIKEDGSPEENGKIKENGSTKENGKIKENESRKESVKIEEDGTAGEETLLAEIMEQFACKEQDIRSFSPLTLAFIGDCVYEIIVRTVVVERGNKSPQNLYKDSVKVVKASVQAKIYEALWEEVSEEEQDIMRRGRNAHFHTKAKNATAEEYKKATGVEALFGYLYLTGQVNRTVELLKLGLGKCGLEL